MAIYVTGDTHGAKQYGFCSVDGFMHRLNIDSFPEQKMMTKDDYVVICGDLVASGILKESLRKKNITQTGLNRVILQHYLCQEIMKITTVWLV